MNWISDSANIDSYINSNLYGGLGQGEGIDLRIEMHTILYGGFGKVPKGHWVILRKYNRSIVSDHYNKRSHEGVGGPAFKYTSELLRTRNIPLSRTREQLSQLKVGIDIENAYIYYFEHMVNPKIGDDILELDWKDHSIKPDINTVKPLERFKILMVHPYRLEHGNIQYWITIAKRDEVNY